MESLHTSLYFFTFSSIIEFLTQDYIIYFIRFVFVKNVIFENDF